MKVGLFYIFLSLGVVSLACSMGPYGVPVYQSGEVLFKDDFSDHSSGWKRGEAPEGSMDYLDGVYRIYVADKNKDIWSYPGLKFVDVHIEVDAAKVGGDDNNAFGVICRYQDDENFYFFLISSDGYYGIGKMSGGRQQLIGTENMPPSESIYQGDASNHLRADCVGNSLSLYVNGEKLAEYQDEDFASGDVGFMVGSFEVPGTEILFDNMMVLQP